MEYKNLIKIVEEKRNELYIKYKKSIFFKRVYYKYYNKYDAFLEKLFIKYGKRI